MWREVAIPPDEGGYASPTQTNFCQPCLFTCLEIQSLCVTQAILAHVILLPQLPKWLASLKAF